MIHINVYDPSEINIPCKTRRTILPRNRRKMCTTIFTRNPQVKETMQKKKINQKFHWNNQAKKWNSRIRKINNKNCRVCIFALMLCPFTNTPLLPYFLTLYRFTSSPGRAHLGISRFKLRSKENSEIFLSSNFVKSFAPCRIRTVDP